MGNLSGNEMGNIMGNVVGNGILEVTKYSWSHS